jgi:hypothetical protein
MHMAKNFLVTSRHGTVFYFRRRVPNDQRLLTGKLYLVKTLATAHKGDAIVLARGYAAQTDAIYKELRDMKKSKSSSFDIDYTIKIELDGFGKPSAITFDGQPHEQDAVNSGIRAAMQGDHSQSSLHLSNPSASKTFALAIAEYVQKAGGKPQTKATYRSKFAHAQVFFGGEECDILKIDQADLVRYADHVIGTIPNMTTQTHYISVVAGFLNWHRTRVSGLGQLTTKTLIPKKDSPESEDRDAYTLDELKDIFLNASKYRLRNPYKFWATVAPAFLGCRIEELCQIHLKTDLIHDSEVDCWYLVFNAKPDPDGIVRKSMKKISAWRKSPIHSSLVRHGFVAFLKAQEGKGFVRPFEHEWKAREVTTDAGDIIKWSQYVSKWGGRELNAVRTKCSFDPSHDLGYFHSMRHTFKVVLGDAGVPTEISEAMSGRRYAGSDAERYEKLKQNHRRLCSEGTERGLGQIVKLLDDVLSAHP